MPTGSTPRSNRNDEGLCKLSSRAVVRKGRLRHLVRATTAGHMFTILDDANRKVDDASIWLGGKEYLPEEDGRILVPYSNRPRRQTFVISRGSFGTGRNALVLQDSGRAPAVPVALLVDRASADGVPDTAGIVWIPLSVRVGERNGVRVEAGVYP